jgi:hypothetical protein
VVCFIRDRLGASGFVVVCQILEVLGGRGVSVRYVGEKMWEKKGSQKF